MSDNWETMDEEDELEDEEDDELKADVDRLEEIKEEILAMIREAQEIFKLGV